ncbi:MAG: polyprenyl synthetase family protein [Pseudomonadota bacterium]
MESFRPYSQHFEMSLKEHFAHRRAENSDVGKLFDSMEYSLFNGGKRFRPMACFAAAEALGEDWKDLTHFAMAVECIHTYSLIHDDLPCMDNDEVRRGKPTNHVQFNEETALLAGDALLSEAPLILASQNKPWSVDLIKLLMSGAGSAGMIRGQVLDLGLGDPTNSLSDLIHLHHMKTGCLISMCFEAPAILAGQNRSAMAELGQMVGLAFQVKDDLLDVDEEENVSFVGFLGEAGSREYLSSLTEKITAGFRELALSSEKIEELISFNLNRDR